MPASSFKPAPKMPLDRIIGLLKWNLGFFFLFTTCGVMNSLASLSDGLRHVGQTGANVIPGEWSSSHLGSSFELSAQRLFGIREKMGTEGENCPALIRCKKKYLDRRSFLHRTGRSKARLAESGHEWRCYRRALISFTDKCEMTSSVVCTHTRHHYRPLYADPPFSPTSSCKLAPTGQKLLQPGLNNPSARHCFVQTSVYYLQQHKSLK